MRDFCVLKAGKGGHNWSVFCFSFFGRVTGFSGLSSEKTEQDFFLLQNEERKHCGERDGEAK